MNKKKNTHTEIFSSKSQTCGRLCSVFVFILLKMTVLHAPHFNAVYDLYSKHLL